MVYSAATVRLLLAESSGNDPGFPPATAALHASVRALRLSRVEEKNHTVTGHDPLFA